MRKIYSMLILTICILSLMNSHNSFMPDGDFKDSVRWTSRQQIANDNVFEWHNFEELS